MNLRALSLVAVVCSLSACKSTDPLYCDDDTPCSDSARSFCDIDGVLPASEGLGNTCIAAPEIESCNRVETCDSEARPHCNAVGHCVECAAAGHCPGETPVCSFETFTCVTCLDATDGDSACVAAYPERPLCSDTGACVQCLGPSDCDAATPVCDEVDRSCRGCVAHDECPSQVCQQMIGSCIASADVVYVDAAGADGAACGTQDAPCATLTAGLALTSDTRRTLRLAAGTYGDSIAVDSGTVTLIGEEGAIVRITGGADAVSVSGTASLRIQNVDFDGSSSAAGSSGMICSDPVETPSLAVDDVEIRGFRGIGISAERCNVSVRRSVLELNQGGGIAITDGDYGVINTIIANNGTAGELGSQRGGVWLENTSGHVQAFEFNTVVGNLAATGAVVASGITCSLTNVTIQSSILRQRGGGGGLGLVVGDCSFTYSDVEGGAAGVGNIDADPLLVNPASGDYHLQPSSPCRDAAEPTAVTPLDIDGDPRPSGPAPDMGADEVTVGD